MATSGKILETSGELSGKSATSGKLLETSRDFGNFDNFSRLLGNLLATSCNFWQLLANFWIYFLTTSENFWQLLQLLATFWHLLANFWAIHSDFCVSFFGNFWQLSGNVFFCFCATLWQNLGNFWQHSDKILTTPDNLWQLLANCWQLWQHHDKFDNFHDNTYTKQFWHFLTTVWQHFWTTSGNLLATFW